MSGYLMAIDAGTGSVRAVIFDLNGNQLGVSQHEWQHIEDPRFPGSMDFDIERNWKLTVGCIKDVIAATGIAPDDILAISTTSMREAIVLYDDAKKELWACANVDARSNAEIKMLKALGSDIEEEIYALSGQTFALGALPRILWIKNNLPDVYKRIKMVTMLNDWLAYRLTGELASEPSNGSTSGMFDIKRREWLPDIAARCGLHTDMFPRVYESGEVIGTVSAACAGETGLSKKTLVVTGGGDAQLGAVGVGAVLDGQVSVFGGSFWQLEYNTKDPVMDEHCRIRVNCHSVRDMWQYEAIAFFPGLVMRWYRDAFCRPDNGSATSGDDVYTHMNREAAKIPAGSYGMMCAFSDVMNYISWRHAAPTFTNFSIDPEKFNKYTFYRAIMENAAIVTRGHLDLAQRITGAKPSVVTFANGASKSPLWCQILADTLNVTVKTPKVKEATALGAAICAGVGAGVFKSTEEACAGLVAFDETRYEPDKNNAAVYDGLYDKWHSMYKAQLSLADGGVTKHMWSAPGL